jgi:hypothetical protein
MKLDAVVEDSKSGLMGTGRIPEFRINEISGRELNNLFSFVSVPNMWTVVAYRRFDSKVSDGSVCVVDLDLSLIKEMSGELSMTLATKSSYLIYIYECGVKSGTYYFQGTLNLALKVGGNIYLVPNVEYNPISRVFEITVDYTKFILNPNSLKDIIDEKNIFLVGNDWNWKKMG